MTRRTKLSYEFVEFIPDNVREGTLFIAPNFATAIHRCCCGCGNEVVTPLSPSDWQLIFDGESVSLRPSIGNWNFECQSHYWIRKNQVEWAARWTPEQIEKGRARDRRAKGGDVPGGFEVDEPTEQGSERRHRSGWFQRWRRHGG